MDDVMYIFVANATGCVRVACRKRDVRSLVSSMHYRASDERYAAANGSDLMTTCIPPPLAHSFLP